MTVNSDGIQLAPAIQPRSRCYLTYLVVFLYLWCGYFFIAINGFTLTQWSGVFLLLLFLLMIGTFSGGALMDKVGRKRGLIIGCAGCGLSIAGVGFLPQSLQIAMVALTGFFFGVASSWPTVYITEIFPTERRATCIGWVTAVGRVAYVAEPALAALLLRGFPTMQGFWIVTGMVMIIPIAIIVLANPVETRQRPLEEITAIR